MCTAIFDKRYGAFFGRTLDLECSFGEKIMRVERGEALRFTYEGARVCKRAIIGMAYYTKSQPLFYDAVNDSGLSAAALNFPHFAKYNKKDGKMRNLASFEVILYLLSQFESVGEAIEFLKDANVTDDAFSSSLPTTPLHWMLADRERAVVVESVAEGLQIHENPFGVMTNSPSFPYHAARICDFSYLSPEPQIVRLLPNHMLTPYSRGLGAYGLPGDYSSSSRFVRALFAKEHTLLPPQKDEIERKAAAQRRIFDILGTVSLPYGIARTEKGEPIYTVYTSCIDMEKCEYSYFTFHNRDIKIFKF